MDHPNVKKKMKRYKLYAEDPSIPIPPSTRYYQKLKEMSKLETESEDTENDRPDDETETNESDDNHGNDGNVEDTEDSESESSDKSSANNGTGNYKRKKKVVKSQKKCSKKIKRIEQNVNRLEYFGNLRTQNKRDMAGTASGSDNHDADQSTSSSDANGIDEQHHTSSDTDSSNLSAYENELDIQTNERYDIDFGENIEEDVDEQESSDEEEITLENIGDVTLEESKLLHLAFALRHNLPDIGLNHLLNLMDCHLPEKKFFSKYKFLQTLPYPEYEVYYYCDGCEVFIEFNENPETECERCCKRYVEKDLKKSGDYFIYIKLKKQIENFLKSKTYCKLRTIPSEVCDIVNGEMYKEMQEKHIIGPNDLTLTWNCDGVQLFEKSSRSMTPLQAMINELPYRDRRSNMFLIGLWMNKRKPIIKLFLRPYVEETLILSLNGIDSETFTSNQCINTKVFALISSVDSVARPVLQNIKQFNGKYGCSCCLEEGKSISVGNGRARIYPYNTIKYRSSANHLKYVEDAVKENKVIKGVKGPSVTQLIPHHDIIFSYPPDYMHGCLLGVGKWFGTEWFNSANNGKPWYLGLKSNEFNRKLLEIKPPCEITRTPQPVSTNYNAHDWRTFIIYYSLPCITNIMPKKYVQHWFLFVLSLAIFLKEKISDAEFIVAEQAIDTFVKNVPKLYEERFMTFNVHLLRHLPLFVKRYGALWAWSAFPFEHFNGVIRQMYHGTQSVPEQICKTYFRLIYLKKNAEIFGRENCSVRGKKLFTQLMKECRVKNCIEHGQNLRVFGKPKTESLSTLQKVLVENLFGKRINSTVKRYDRFIFKNILYHSTNYKRLVKRDNSCVITYDSQILRITGLICIKFLSTEEYEFVVLGKKFNVLNESLCRFKNFHSNMFSFMVRQSPSQICVRVESIKSKVVNILVDTEDFDKEIVDEDYCRRSIIVPLVNNIETD